MIEVKSYDPANYSSIDMGEQQTFEKVFRTYHKSLCFYTGRLVADEVSAEDVVSEVFMQLWKQRRIFESEDHARFYLYRAARHAALNHLKNYRRSVEKYEHVAREYDDTEEAHQERYIRSEVLREIYTQIESLPAQERKVLLFTLREGKKLQEIADEMGLSLQTVKNCKNRAVRRLRTRLSVEDFLVLLTLLSSGRLF